MDLIGTGEVMHGGTANANVMSMAAGKVALERIRDGDTIETLKILGHRLMTGLRDLNTKYEVGMSVQGPGPMFAVSFTGGKEITDARAHFSYSDTRLYEKFVDGMMKEGVRVVGRGMWFISESLTEEDIELTLSAADRVLGEIVR
jgi:glutamate-1-semialdehyde 2,1-aminomutase